MTSDCSSIDDLRVRLAIYASEYRLGEFRWLYRCCELALRALEQGNYGVGAVLVDRDSNLLVEAGNQVFSEGFDSSAHAEMRVIDQFERMYPNYPDRKGLQLITSLEPCPMCCGRILAAGIGQIIYLSQDKSGGMMSHCDNLPAAWVNLSQLIVIKHFHKQHELSDLAQDIAAAQMGVLREKLMLIIRS
ncbi:nucleoside deaminase [Neptuniibacter pectenicola]|jgi:cytosine deaminase|uniref:Nucleoside deaminase n=1 Tax=Neptuniibacter pectenicola TaxID=1806669 RepID=A0ABU9TRR5_9GAMM|nr:nucleoside deaminase [Neptuniibacter pectenicola]|tara:strand:- start:1233 stop:1799 length:567 start_codon:yes stop_codon:yes gene_type:complete